MMNAQQQHQRQLVVVVEGTAALGPSWALLQAEYVEKIVRAFCSFNGAVQKHSTAPGEMALVVFYSRGSHNGCLIQRSGWTSSLDIFLRWLSSIHFNGGGFGDAAIAEGLAEGLSICCPGPNVPTMPQGIERQKHCLLVATSNPHRLPTPVSSPPGSSFLQGQSNSGDVQGEQWWLADADTVAQAFSPCLVSLSILAPRQLPLLRNIFTQAKRTARTSESATEPPKQYPQHLVLVSDGFLEARVALRAVITNPMGPNGHTAKIEHQSVPVTGSTVSGQIPASGLRPTPGSVTGIGVMSGRPGPNVPIPAVTVKSEGVTTGSLSSLLHNNTNNNLLLPVQQLAPSGTLSNQDSLQNTLTSLTTVDTKQDFKALGNIPSTQPLRPVGGGNLPNNNMLAHSPSQSRHTIGSPSLPPASPLSGLQSSGVSNMMSSNPGGANSLAGSQGTLGHSGQPVGVGMASNTGGLNVGQGGVSSLHGGYTSGTGSVVNNPMLGSVQPGSMVNNGVVSTGQGMVSGVSGQGGLPPSNQMGQVGLSNIAGQTMMASSGNSGVSSATGTMMPTPGIPQSPSQVPPLGSNNPGVSNSHLAPPATVAPQQQPSVKYTKLWEGILAGQRKGNLNPIPICKLEGYRQTSSSETLATDWPSTMQIMRLIPQDYMNQKDYQHKAELLIFRPLTQHDFLVQLAEKKLCAVIQLPIQTLLLASTDKPGRMIGMLFPGEMVQIKPQVSSQQQQAASGSSAPQAVAASGFAQNQMPNNPLTSGQVSNLQSRTQLMTGPTGLHNPGSASLHGTGFLP